MDQKDITAIVDAIVSHERFDTLFGTVVQLDTRVSHLEHGVSELKESMHAMQQSIDHLAKSVDTLLMEYTAIKMRQDRHERWLQQLAAHVGVELTA